MLLILNNEPLLKHTEHSQVCGHIPCQHTRINSAVLRFVHPSHRNIHTATRNRNQSSCCEQIGFKCSVGANDHGRVPSSNTNINDLHLLFSFYTCLHAHCTNTQTHTHTHTHAHTHTHTACEDGRGPPSKGLSNYA